MYINFTGPLYDGLRPLKVVNWEMTQMSLLNTEALKQFLNTLMSEAIQLNQFYIKIPILTLEPFLNYVFKFTFENFHGIRGTAYYSFVASSNEAPVVKIDKTYPHVYYP